MFLCPCCMFVDWERKREKMECVHCFFKCAFSYFFLYHFPFVCHCVMSCPKPLLHVLLKEPVAEQDTDVHDNPQTSSITEYHLEGKADDGVKDSEEKDKDKGKGVDKEKSKEKDFDRKTEREKEKIRAVDGASLDNLLQRLPGCVSRDLIDQLTVLTQIVLSIHFMFNTNYHS